MDAKAKGRSFSLRTLMIIVFVIGFSWTLTATWGIANVLGRVPEQSFIIKTGTNVVCVQRVDADGSVYEWESRAFAPAPFYITITTHGRYPDGYEFDIKTSYFWFLGYSFCLTGQLQRPKK